MVCPVDEKGLFTHEVSDYEGMYVKDADKLILKHLSHSGHLIKQTQVKHSYPFCWRSDTPLLYMAIPSWFVRVEPLVPKLLKNNADTYWQVYYHFFRSYFFLGFRHTFKRSDLEIG